MGKSSKIIQKHFEFLIFWFDIHNNMFPHIVKKFFLINIEKCKCYECLTTIVFFPRNGHHTVDRNIAPASSLSFSSSSSIVSLLVGGASLSWEAVSGSLERPKSNSVTFLVYVDTCVTPTGFQIAGNRFCITFSSWKLQDKGSVTAGTTVLLDVFSTQPQDSTHQLFFFCFTPSLLHRLLPYLSPLNINEKFQSWPI